MTKNQRYCVVKETRPHTDAPHIKRERYLSNGGRLESAFVAATRYDNQFAAVNAMYQHGIKIANQHQHYPAPPETVLEVIECEFSVLRSVTVADVIKSEQED